MSGRSILIFAMSVLGCFPLGLEARPRYQKIEVTGPLKTELNQVLRAASDLHLARVSGNEQKIEASVRDLLQRLNRAKATRGLGEGHQHLNKMLDKARTSLQSSRGRAESKRRENLKEAFSQIVQIAQVYKLDNYKIFFCAKDKGVWIQKAPKPANPFDPVRNKGCGRLVQTGN